ncbi:MAG: DUF2336 domain-containing protein [Hyphomicrobiales bacterium]
MENANLLDQLTSLAREDSSDRRRDLLRALTDLYLTDGVDPDEAAEMLYGEIVVKVVDQVSIEGRIELAERLAPHENAPHAAVVKLASDDIAVAGPILRQSSVLTDADLVAIAQSQNDEHMMAIATRPELSTSVTDVLVDRGSANVLQSVSRNAGAQFSDYGFQTLATKADGDETLQEILAGRKDMPEEARSQLMSVMSDALKKRLEDEGKEIDKRALAVLAKTAVARVEQENTESETLRARVSVMIEEVRLGKRRVDSIVNLICRQDRALDLGWALASLAEVPEAGVGKAVLNNDPGPLAMICKVLGVSEDSYLRVAEMRRKRLRLPQSAVGKEAKQYAALSEADAQRAFRFLKVRRAANAG